GAAARSAGGGTSASKSSSARHARAPVHVWRGKVMIKELNHVGIEVENLEESLRFYRDILGGRVVWESRLDFVPLDIVMLEVAGSLVELLHHPAGPTPDRPLTYGVNHLA